MAKCKSTWLEMQESGVQFPVQPPCGWVKVPPHTLKHVLEPAQTYITFKDMAFWNAYNIKVTQNSWNFFVKNQLFQIQSYSQKQKLVQDSNPGSAGFQSAT